MVMEKKKSQPRVLYPTELRIKKVGEIITLTDKHLENSWLVDQPYKIQEVPQDEMKGKLDHNLQEGRVVVDET